jgi:hypothetical protein
MYKYDSIEHFRHLVASVTRHARFAGLDHKTGTPVYDDSRQLPKLTFRGTVKLHGTNAGIVQKSTEGSLQFQSRNNAITPQSDNAGFATEMNRSTAKLLAIFDRLRKTTRHLGVIAIYGEWCGQGIQKGVAIAQLTKRFVVFGIRCLDPSDGSSKWLDLETLGDLLDRPDLNIYNICHFPTFQLEIDFGCPESSQPELERRTLEVSQECPVAREFGVSGPGEGIVWSPIDVNHPHYRSYLFKTKGEQYQPTSHSKIASANPERVKTVGDFVDRTVTDIRCRQGLEYLEEQKMDLTKRNIARFVEWVRNDILKEERDILEESGLEERDVKGPINKKASSWFMTQIL